jgi:hypothetical protein
VAESGPIPNREQGHLLIKDIAIGSFGFEFEESCSKRHPFGDESPIATALQQTQDLLRGTVGTDDELTEAVAGLSSRAIKSARAFLEILVSADAVCALEYRDRVFGFQDVAEVRRGESRLSQENVHEETLSYSGEFQGVLPKRRTFEFKLAPDHVIRGRIGPAIENPDILNRHLHQPARISVTATRIGTGRPRLVLNALPEWSAEPSEQAM